jgi:glycosyltransferase involved in cell wall biosynthesis
MRILIAHSFYRLAGGEDTYVRRQAELLGPHHDVSLLERSNEALAGNMRTALRMLWSPALTRDVEARIDECRPDVVHLHNAYPSLGSAVHLAAERRQVPLVMTVHNTRLRCPNGLMFTEGSQCRRCEKGAYAHAVLHECFPSRRQGAVYAAGLWAHRFPMALERRVVRYVAPSGFMASQLLQWGIPAERVVVVRNFTPARPGASEAPGSYGLFVGRLAAEKGVDVLLRALAAAGDPPFRIVGTGPLAELLQTLARQLRLRNTSFMGQLRQADVRAVVRNARFLALPSICTENAPLAALEAMVEGRPLLVSDIGGLPELIHGGAGVACAAGDVTGLAQRIAEWMHDDARCRRAGGKALEFAESFLAPERHRRQLESVYERATTLLPTTESRA